MGGEWLRTDGKTPLKMNMYLIERTEAFFTEKDGFWKI
jgi:hypothetical protein